MNYSKIYSCSIVDGPGVRVSLYVSGCKLHCKGCHNQEAWDFSYGDVYTEETQNYILDLLSKSYIKGLSILGGEPLDEQNQSTIADLVLAAKTKYPEKDIWIWTGYEEKEIRKNLAYTESLMKILENADFMVTGRFEIDKRDITSNNPWCGSTNQKIIQPH